VPDLPATSDPDLVAENGAAALDALAAVALTAEPERKAAPWRGRKKVADARTKFVAVRLTPAKHAAYEAAAAKAGLSVGAYLRALADGAPGPRAVRRPKVEHVALAQVLGALGRVGSNVNQLARVANTAGTLPQTATLNEVRQEICLMRTALMKALGRGD
jgi:hypothetical protein